MNLLELNRLYDEDKLIGSFKISNEDYHAGPGISSTFLCNIMEYSVAHAKYWKENPQEPSSAMKKGSLVHMACLEPELIRDTYLVVSDIRKNTKEGKANLEIAKEQNKEAITEDMLHEVGEMRKSLLSSQTGKTLFGEGISEQAYYARDLNTELLMKCKADFINTKHKILIDLKTTSDGRLWHIKNAIRDYSYKIQAAYYLDVINLAMKTDVVTDAIWVFVESSAPYGIRFIEIKKEWREHGFNLYKEALERYKHAIETGDFAGYSSEIISLQESEGA